MQKLQSQSWLNPVPGFFLTLEVWIVIRFQMYLSLSEPHCLLWISVRTGLGLGLGLGSGLGSGSGSGLGPEVDPTWSAPLRSHSAVSLQGLNPQITVLLWPKVFPAQPLQAFPIWSGTGFSYSHETPFIHLLDGSVVQIQMWAPCRWQDCTASSFLSPLPTTVQSMGCTERWC